MLEERDVPKAARAKDRLTSNPEDKTDEENPEAKRSRVNIAPEDDSPGTGLEGGTPPSGVPADQEATRPLVSHSSGSTVRKADSDRGGTEEIRPPVSPQRLRVSLRKPIRMQRERLSALPDGFARDRSPMTTT